MLDGEPLFRLACCCCCEGEPEVVGAPAAAPPAAAGTAESPLKARVLVPAILRSLPRPLMPLFEFLYRVAKYSHSSLSAGLMGSPSRMVANFCVNRLSEAAWNLFWWD